MEHDAEREGRVGSDVWDGWACSETDGNVEMKSGELPEAATLWREEVRRLLTSWAWAG